MQNKKFKKKRSTLIISVITIILILVIGTLIFIYNKNEKATNYNGNSLIGTFLYEKNKTKYIFNENGTGSMDSGDYHFEYEYNINENILEIDFADKKVNDVKYLFELNNGILKLISQEGTISIGEEYILEKENK